MKNSMFSDWLAKISLRWCKEFTNVLRKLVFQSCNLSPRLVYEKYSNEISFPIYNKVGSHCTAVKHTTCEPLIIDVITKPAQPIASRYPMGRLQRPHLINRFP